MTSLEQLETLRRQVEEDYKLDLAAIDRLQRRFNEAIACGSKVVNSPVEQQHAIEPQTQPEFEPQNYPAFETRGVTLVQAVDLRPQQPDQRTDSLRTMFSNYR